MNLKSVWFKNEKNCKFVFKDSNVPLWNGHRKPIIKCVTKWKNEKKLIVKFENDMMWSTKKRQRLQTMLNKSNSVWMFETIVSCLFSFESSRSGNQRQKCSSLDWVHWSQLTLQHQTNLQLHFSWTKRVRLPNPRPQQRLSHPSGPVEVLLHVRPWIVLLNVATQNKVKISLQSNELKALIQTALPLSTVVRWLMQIDQLLSWHSTRRLSSSASDRTHSQTIVALHETNQRSVLILGQQLFAGYTKCFQFSPTDAHRARPGHAVTFAN